MILTLSLLKVLQRGPSGWVEYLKGIAWALQGAGHELRRPTYLRAMAERAGGAAGKNSA